MSLLDDVVSKLTTAGVVGSGWTACKSYLPDSPDQVVVVNETGGGEPDENHEWPDFQVLVRGHKFEYDVARTKAEAVYNALHDSTIAGYVYVLAKNSGVLPIGYDESDRPMMTINFSTMTV